jgi:hypothetical protein
MPRFSYEDADKYGSKGGGANFFQLKQDGETAKVHLLGNDMNDFPGYAVHRVPVGDSYRYVNCLREAGESVDVCPFCAEGKHNPEISKIYAKVFIPLYDIDSDSVKIWERGKSFYKELSSYASHTPNMSKAVTEIERSGKKGDTNTSYRLYKDSMDEKFDIANVAEDIPEVLGTIILDKTAEDMEYYLRKDKFPNDTDSDDTKVVRRGSRADDDKPSRRDDEERRRPSRRNDEDDY